MTPMIRRGLLLVALLAATGAGYGIYEASRFLAAAPSSAHETRVVQVPRGATLRSIARLLESEGVVTDARKFAWYVRYRKAAEKLKAGELRFYTDQAPAQVLEVLLKGEEVRYRLTIPEGFRITEMAPVVSTLPFLDGSRFVQLAQDPEVARALGINAPTLEGFLFPSTYALTRSQDERALIEAMVRELKSYWTPEKEARARALHMTQLEVVTLASIIEKETAHASERPLVSSVFHNRLKRGMKLEADPTIIYGLRSYDGNIRRTDIRRAHAWNTYVITGLPPTPIASPGAGALEAALYPAETDYLFFVARRDRTHVFSKTYAAHARNVRIHQLRR